jgi:perosamine synthetase
MYQKLQSINFFRYFNRQSIQRSGSPFLFSHARTALKYGLHCLQISEGSEVLLPEFICDVVLQPFSELHIMPKYYRVTESLEPEWNDVTNQLSSNTSAIIMIHYFGFPQNIETFQEFATKNNIILIEDNAHGFGGQYKGQLLGTFGDIGIVSPRKSFPTLNGAYLYLRQGSIDLSEQHFPLEPKNIIFHQIRESVKTVVKSPNFMRKKILKAPPYAELNGFHETTILDWGMDLSTYLYLTKQDVTKAVELRQEIFVIWQIWAEKQGLQPVFKTILDQQWAPLVFPAYTRTKDESRKWFEWGFKNGIDIHSWPSLPKEVQEQSQIAIERWEKLLCFPINTGMNPSRLKRKLDKCKVF